ncbi:MAG: PAS domain S-box protein [Flavobacterium sp.]
MNSISNQILTSILITVLIIFGGWGFYEIENTTQYEKENVEQSQQFAIKRLAYNLAHPVWNLNEKEIRENIKNEAFDENIGSILVFDEDDKFYSGVFKDQNGTIKNMDSNILIEKQTYFSTQNPKTHPILYNGKEIGKVAIFTDPKPLLKHIGQLRIHFLIELLVLICILAGILYLVLHKVIIRPLLQLQNWVSKTDYDKNQISPKFQSKEINSLFLSFTQMTQRLISSFNKISDNHKKLQESESHIKSISNNFTSGMIYQVITRMDGYRKFTYLSDSVKQLYGITPEEGVADASLIYNKIHEDDVENLINAEIEAMKTLTTFRMEVRMKQLGGYRWSSFVSTPKLLDDGSVCWDGIEFDITIQKQTEEELRISQQKFAAAFSTSPDAILITDRETGHFVEVNESMKDIFGFSREEVLGKTSLELGLYPTPEERERMINELQKNGFVRKTEALGKHRSGKILNLLVSVESSNFNNKQYYISTLQDITERKKAEAELQYNQFLLQSITEGTSDAIFVKDVQGRYIVLNSAAAKFVGKKREDIIGKDDTLFFPPDEAKELMEIDRRIMESGVPQTHEEHLSTTSGPITFLVTKGPLLDKEGNVIGLFGISRDITERKQIEIELQNLNRDKDRFMSILGHDLRSPFNAILGLIDLLRIDIHSMKHEEIEALLKLINRSAQNASDLLDSVLIWSMNQSGKMNFSPEPISVEESCSDIIETLQSVANTKNISLHHDVPNGMTLFADRNMFNTIVRNLASNAIKFTNSNGKVVISAQETPENITISVTDNGSGIHPDNIAKIFDKKELYSSTGTDNEKGTGFGLKLCQEFVEKHNGKIWVESELGKGSTFFFSLPKV